MILTFLTKYRDFGLLLLRVGLGIMFILHGWPKIAGGPELWAKLGGAMSHVGIDFFPVFWGFMAAISELIGGFLVVIGFAFRPACILLAGTMTVATLMKINTGDGLSSWAHPAEMAIVFYSLILIGAGRFSLDRS